MNQKGFSSIEIIMAMVIVALISVVAFLGYQSMNKNQMESKQQTTANSTAKSTSADESTVQLAEAKKFVNDFYLAYYNKDSEVDGKGDRSVTSADLAKVVQQYATADFVTKYNDSATDLDPVLCSQNIPETPPRVTAAVLRNGSPKVTVTQSYTEGPGVTIIVNLTSGMSPKVASVECAG